MALLLLFSSCSKDSTPAPLPPQETQHTLMFLFIGTELQEFFNANIKQVCQAFTPQLAQNNRIVMYCRRGPAWQIVEIKNNPATGVSSMETLKYMNDLDLRDPAFITTVLGEMAALAPAHSYGLVLGGHGTGWLPKGRHLPMAVRAPFTLKDPAGGFYPMTRAFGERGSNFDIDELAHALSQVNVPIDYLIFDDCFMSNIETLYTMRHSVRYIVGSPCEIMAEGFPYKYVIPAVMHNSLPLEARLKEVCNGYYRFYNEEFPNAAYRSGCIALTVCSELEELASVTRQIFTSAPRECDPATLQTYEGCNSHLFYDFGQYVTQTASDPTMLQVFNEQFDRAFPAECRLHTEKFYSAVGRAGMYPITYYSGVTCSTPATVYDVENRQTEWWMATH